MIRMEKSPMRSKYMLSIGNALYIQRYKQFKIKRMKNIYYANSKHKNAGVAILISDKINFKTENIKS